MVVTGDDGARHEGSGTGDGPVNALMRAIDAAIGSTGVLLEYQVSAVTGGTDALGEARVVCEISGRNYSGQGVSTRCSGSNRGRVPAGGRRESPRRARRTRDGRGGLTPMGKTLFDKLWEAHEVRAGGPDGPPLLFIDLHLVHEVTSPQAFDGLRLAGRRVRRPDLTIATVDHNVPTIGREKGIEDVLSRTQIEALERNCAEFGIPLFSIRSPRQGIVHVIGPELGLTQPGHDDRLRRLAHLDPRGVRGAGIRDRHLRGRARLGHTDAAADSAPDDAGAHRGRASARGRRAKTSSSGPSDGWASPGPRATSSSTPVRRFGRCQWRGA